ncbi:MAG: hypothetical protein V1661_03140 [bacterium]
MKALLQNIQGVRRSILESSVVLALLMAVFCLFYKISGGSETNAYFVANVAVIIAGILAISTLSIGIIAPFVAPVITALVIPAAIIIIGVIVKDATSGILGLIGIGAFLIAFVSVLAADAYEIKYWKALIVCVAEDVLFFSSIYFAPYLAIGILAFSVAFVFILLAESGYRLKRNPPTVA